MFMQICIGKRLYGRNKFRWFYSPMLKENMKSGGIIIFWWLGHNWYFCLKKTNGKCVFENWSDWTSLWCRRVQGRGTSC